MDFGKAKTVLIVLFLFINIFLLCHIILLSDSTTKIDKNAITDTVGLLNDRGIKIDEELIPTRLDNMDYLEFLNPLTDENSFASTILGNAKIEGDFYSGDNGKLYIKDGAFLWEPISSIDLSKDDLSDKKTASKVLEFLNKHGIPKNSFKWKKTSPLENEFFQIEFNQTYLERELFFIDLKVTLSKKGISKVEGKFFKIESVKNVKDSLKSPLTVLLEFSSENTFKNPVKIVDFSSGYYTDTSSHNYKFLPAIPCWKITLENNQTFFYDSISLNQIIF